MTRRTFFVTSAGMTGMALMRRENILVRARTQRNGEAGMQATTRSTGGALRASVGLATRADDLDRLAHFVAEVTVG